MGVRLAESERQGSIASMVRGSLMDLRTGMHMVAAPDIPKTPQAFDIQSNPQSILGSGKGRRVLDRAAAFLGALATVNTLHAPAQAQEVQGTGILCVDGEVRNTPLPNEGGLLIVFSEGISAAHINTSVSPPHRRTPDSARRSITSVKGRNGHHAEMAPPGSTTVKITKPSEPTNIVTISGTSATCNS